MIVKLDVNNMEKFEAYKKAFRDNHEGTTNAYKTLFLAAGADATVVGQNFQQMDFKALQGSAETRIAAAAGVHPAIVGLSEGLQGSSLNAGNFTAAARLTGDKTLRPLWRNFCGAISNVIDVPGGSRLWYDTRDVAFLQADEKDIADVQQIEAITMRQLIETGFEPDSVTAAVMAQDWSKLKHTDLISVQLQPIAPPPQQMALPMPEPATNGKDANVGS
jgi:phage portal protein BeeE